MRRIVDLCALVSVTLIVLVARDVACVGLGVTFLIVWRAR